MNRDMLEIIRHQIPLTMPPETAVQQACARMHDRRVGAVLVTNEAGRLLGIFTGRDAVEFLAGGKDAAAISLGDVMTPNPDVLPSGAKAIEALRLMRDGGFRHLPVVENDLVIGIVSRGDFRGLEHDRLDVETGLWESMR